MSKYLVNVSTEHIYTIKKAFSMLQDVSPDDVNIIFRKNTVSNKIKIFDSDGDTKNENNAKNSGGMLIRVINSHQTVISMIKLDMVCFNNNVNNEFYVDDNEFSFWLSMKELNKCFDCMDNGNYTLHMSVTKKNNKTLKLLFQHNEFENRREEYSLGFIEFSVDIPKIKQTDFDTKINISTKIFFKEICNKINKFSSMFELCCNKDSFVINYKTDSNKINKMTYGNGDFGIQIIVQDKHKEIQTQHDVDTLNCLKDIISLTDKITLNLKHNFPLFITCMIGENDEVLGRMMSYLSQPDNQNSVNYHEQTKDCYTDKKAVMK